MTERYDNLDGLRTISCLCIIAMHIKANADYVIDPTIHTFMVSWTHLVLLFILISGFGMCCGYYERFKSKTIDLNSFYSKRYKKLAPFFIMLIIIDIVLNRSLSHIIEGATEATLIFGLLPNNQPEVIGVCWTLGVVFLFYMLFPFFVFLCWNKRRAWISFGISIIVSVFCSAYFFTDKFVIEGFTPRHSILYCAPFFTGGAIVYLYRDKIVKLISKFRWLSLAICILFSICWYLIPMEVNKVDITNLSLLFVFLPWLMYAISVKSRILNNRCTKYLSGISMELYLSHMIAFRVIEKVKGLYLFGHGWISLVVTWIMIMAILILFISLWKKATSFIVRISKKTQQGQAA